MTTEAQLLMQAEDRAHRIGQQDVVNIKYLLAPKTLDDVIWPMLERKLSVLEGAGLTTQTDLHAQSSEDRTDPQQPKINDFFKKAAES